MVPVARKARIFSHGVLTRYPFQGNLHGLPPEVVVRVPASTSCARTTTRASTGAGRRTSKTSACKKFGAGISQPLHDPVQPEAVGRAPARDHRRVVLALRADPEARGRDQGRRRRRAAGDGLQRLVPLSEEGRHRDADARARRARWRAARSRCSTRRRRRSTSTRRDGHHRRRDASRGARWSRPSRCPSWSRGSPTRPREIEEAAAKLRCTPVRYLNVATKRRRNADFHWIYVPEEKYPVLSRRHLHQRGAGDGAARARLALRRAVRSRRRCRRSTTSCPTWRRRWSPPARSTAPTTSLFAEMKELKYAYVVFDEHYYASVATIMRFLEANDDLPARPLRLAGSTTRWKTRSWPAARSRSAERSDRAEPRRAEVDDAARLSIVIPVYNEEGILHSSVVDLIERLDELRLGYEILLAENGSRDRTVEIGEELADKYPQVHDPLARRAELRQGAQAGHPARARPTSSSATRSISATPTSTSARSRILERDDADMVVGSKVMEGADDRAAAVPPHRDAGDQRHAARAGRLPRHRHPRAQGVPPRGAARHRRALRARRATCSPREFVIRAEREGKRVREIPIHIVEKRPPIDQPVQARAQSLARHRAADLYHPHPRVGFAGALLHARSASDA